MANIANAYVVPFDQFTIFLFSFQKKTIKFKKTFKQNAVIQDARGQ